MNGLSGAHVADPVEDQLSIEQGHVTILLQDMAELDVAE